MLGALVQRAAAEYPARQSMLLASRDYLQTMLEQAQFAPGPDEQEFNLLLQDSDRGPVKRQALLSAGKVRM
jgi:hypothetical protein